MKSKGKSVHQLQQIFRIHLIRVYSYKHITGPLRQPQDIRKYGLFEQLWAPWPLKS